MGHNVLETILVVKTVNPAAKASCQLLQAQQPAPGTKLTQMHRSKKI